MITPRTQSPDLALSIGRLIGSDRVRESAGREREPAGLVAEPADEGELAEVVRRCEAERLTLGPLGAARTLSQIRLTPVALGISLARMTRVSAYEPDDMTVVVQAGASLGELNRMMALRGQWLPVDPCDPDATTIGALVGASHAGPLRLSQGTVRDLLIGVRFTGCGGRTVQAGGRVVKNVAGYDLMKVMTGSFGTLGIVTEAAFKVRPVPENHSIALAAFRTGADAFSAAQRLTDRMTLVYLEALSPAASAALGHPAGFVLLAGFAGNRRECDYQRGKILEVLGRAEIVEGKAARDTYHRLRDFKFPADAVVAQVAVPPTALEGLLRDSSAEFRAHAGSGVAQLWTAGGGGGGGMRAVERWRSHARQARGNLRVLAIPDAIHGAIAMFDEPPAGAFALMKRLKAAFDPAGIFNPGCFVGGL